MLSSLFISLDLYNGFLTSPIFVQDSMPIESADVLSEADHTKEKKGSKLIVLIGNYPPDTH